MNKNTSILLGIIILFLVSYYLYWKSEKDFEKASADFAILAFENTELNCNKNSLEFFITNNLLEEKEFEVSIKINESNFRRTSMTIPAKVKEHFSFSDSEVASICQKEKPLKISVSTKLESKNQDIYKMIK